MIKIFCGSLPSFLTSDFMEDGNAEPHAEEPMEQAQDSSPEAENLSQRLEALENSVRYLEDNMMTRLSVLEERVEELMRRMDGFSNISRRWSTMVSLDLPSLLPEASTMPPASTPQRQINKQGMLTARRVRRRYQRLVKSSWDEKSQLRRVIKKLEKKKRERS